MESHKITRFVFTFLLASLAGLVVFLHMAPKAQAAQYQYAPTSENLIAGTESQITSGTASAAGGTNIGSWKAAIADDNLQWTITGVSGGNLDAQLNLANVALNGANKMIVQTEVDVDAAIALKIQICDWVSSTSVDSAADAQCTTGGWRSINSQDAANADIGLTTIATPVQLTWHLFDGYFTTGTTGGTAVSTPLCNFFNTASNCSGTAKAVKIRYFSTTSLAVIDIDYLRIEMLIDSIYFPSAFTKTTGGTVAGTYANTFVMGNTTTAQQAAAGSDNVKLSVGATAGVATDIEFTFNNVKTLPNMNTVLVRMEYICGAASGTHTPQIRNYNSSSWENLPASAINCAAADATSSWAKNNVTLSNYISGGQMKVRVTTTTLNQSFSVDQIYLIVGSTNTDTALCEVSLGSGTASNCSNARTIDETGTASTFDNTAEDESATMGTGESNSIYGMDFDNDANLEEATSANISMPVGQNSDTQIVGINYAGRFAAGSPGATALTVQMGLKDYSGLNQVLGGWTQVGTTSATATLVYTDSVTALAAGVYGLQISPEDYYNPVTGLMNVRLRSTAAGTNSTNSVTAWDFVMVSPQWVEDTGRPTKAYQFIPTSGTLAVGTDGQVNSSIAAAGSGVNMGSWKGTLADDNLHWTVTGTGSGTNMQLNIDNVQLNGANKIIIQTEIDTDAAISAKVQICDWVSSTSVDSAADSNCTVGGWRSLNSQSAANADLNFSTIASGTGLQWHIYDGYWSTGTTGGAAVSTPLSNFISNDTNQRVKIRYFSATASAVIDVDFLRIINIIDSVYTPGGFVATAGGTVTGTYASANPIGNTTAAQQTVVGSDNVKVSMAANAGAANDVYFIFKNVKTLTGMNSIAVRMEYICGTTTGTLTPYIRNFNGSTWDALTAAIACAAADATNGWAKNNVTLSNYISTSNEVWVRLLHSTTNQTMAVDAAYIMIGSTNANTANCEITFGTGTSTNCSNTDTLDMTGTTTTFDNPAEDESTTMGTGEANSFYGACVDQDATLEEATCSNVVVPITAASNTQIVGEHYSARFAAGTAGATALTVGLSLKDFSGYNQGATGGFAAIGATSNSATQVYTDSLTALAISTYGIQSNPEDYFDWTGGGLNFRLRTTASGTAATNATTNWDFVLGSLQWIETNISLAGTAYAIDDSTVLSAYASSVKAVVNGTAYSATASSGVFSITAIPTPAWGTPIILYLDSNGGSQGATVVKYGLGCANSGSCTGLRIVQNTLLIDSKAGISPLANTDLASCDNDAGPCSGDIDAKWNVDGSNILTDSFSELKVSLGTVFTPAERVLAGTIRIKGTINGTSGKNLSVNNDWINDGTYNANTGELVVNPQNATATVIGGTSNTSFYNLTIQSGDRVVQFKAGSTFPVSGLLKLNGTATQPLVINSTIPGNRWFITFTGTTQISAVLLKDAGCSGGNAVNPPMSVGNLGNNDITCWNFMSGGGGGNGGPPPEGGGAGGSGSSCTPATATANMSSGSVSSVTVNTGGSCYGFPPNVVFIGDGGGAVATATISGGAVTAVTMIAGGSGYSSPPVIHFTSGQGNAGNGGGGSEGSGAGGGGGSGGGGSGGGGGASP